MNPGKGGRGRRFDREITALAIPALGALAADPLVSMVDTAFVGRLGTVPLAALGVNASVFAMTFVVFNFLAYGTTPRVARALGRGDRGEVGRVVLQALVLAVAAGVVATALLLALAGPILSVMGATGELREPAMAYLRIRALAGPAVLLIMAGHGVFRGLQDTRTPLRITLALNVVNLVLDPILIFGLGWGLEGAAWATVVAQWAGALAFVRLIFGPRRAMLGESPRWPRPAELLPFLRVGGELLLRTGALIGTLTLATAVATRVGTAQVAAHQVAVQLWMLLALVVDSLAVAAQAMVGKYRGADESREGVAVLREVTNRLLLWGAGVGVVLLGLFWVAAPWLPRIFTDDPLTLLAVAAVLPFVVFMQPLNALVFVWDGIFMGAEDFRYLAVQMVLSALAAAGILLLVLPMGWGLAGVWWGITALMGVRAATLAVRYWGRRGPGR
ncbi:MAG: MATE family efflux transporter [Gemmatimonadales bacterium]|nr:MAG: MATE family efflux transporter [Gemmatimonadales bacterium]